MHMEFRNLTNMKWLEKHFKKELRALTIQPQVLHQAAIIKTIVNQVQIWLQHKQVEKKLILKPEKF